MMRVDVAEDVFVDLIERHANREYWKEIVAAVQRRAAENGFVFAKTGIPAEMTVELKTSLSFAAARARNAFLCPDIEQERVNTRTEWDMEDGFARLYLERILAALETQGIALRSNVEGIASGTR
jgi:hypothetical protein